MQCACSFILTLFRPDVDVVNKVITAILMSVVDIKYIDNTGYVAMSATDVLAVLSLANTTANTLALGDMLSSCIFNVRQSDANNKQKSQNQLDM
jgi:hypothetical protein